MLYEIARFLVALKKAFILTIKKFKGLEGGIVEFEKQIRWQEKEFVIFYKKLEIVYTTELKDIVLITESPDHINRDAHLADGTVIEHDYLKKVKGHRGLILGKRQ